MLLWLKAAPGSVWERGGECRIGTWPDAPLFRTHHAKILLIRLIKCLVGTGPMLHAIYKPSSTTPTPTRHPFIFHTLPLGLLSAFNIALETCATFLLPAKGCFFYLKGVEISHEYCFCFSWITNRTNDCRNF